MVPHKWDTPCKKCLKVTLFAKDWVIFERKFLNMMYDSDLRSWDPH